MAKLVYAKDDKIMVSPENIPTKDDTVAVDSIEALKDYKLIYEGKDSTADARVILGSTTGIPADSDAEIYKAKKDDTEDEDTGSQTPDPTPSDTPVNPEGGEDNGDGNEGSEGGEDDTDDTGDESDPVA